MNPSTTPSSSVPSPSPSPLPSFTPSPSPPPPTVKPERVSSLRQSLIQQVPRKTGRLRVELHDLRNLKHPTPELVPALHKTALKDFVVCFQHGEAYHWTSPPVALTTTFFSHVFHDTAFEWEGVLSPPLDSVWVTVRYRDVHDRLVCMWRGERALTEREWSTSTQPPERKLALVAMPPSGSSGTPKYVGDMSFTLQFTADADPPLEYKPLWRKVGKCLSLPYHLVPEWTGKGLLVGVVDWCVDGLLEASQTLNLFPSSSSASAGGTTTPPPSSSPSSFLFRLSFPQKLLWLGGLFLLLASVSVSFACSVVVATLFFPLTALLVTGSLLSVVGLGFPAFLFLSFILACPPVNDKLLQPTMRKIITRVPFCKTLFLEAEKEERGGGSGGGGGAAVAAHRSSSSAAAAAVAARGGGGAGRLDQ